MGSLGFNSIFEENTSAFENLKSFGFNIISNDNLRRKITSLYSARYEYANKIFNNNNDFYWNKFTPQLIEHTSSETGKFRLRTPNDLKSIASDLSFLELLRQDVFMKGFTIDLSRRVENDIKEVLLLINIEIKK